MPHQGTQFGFGFNPFQPGSFRSGGGHSFGGALPFNTSEEGLLSVLRRLGLESSQFAFGGDFIRPADPTLAAAIGRFQGLSPQLDRFLEGAGGRSGQAFDIATGQFDPASAEAFFNPFQEQVIDAVRADFGNQRDLARRASQQAATGAGAFGGSRAAVETGARLGELDRAELGTISGLRQSGFQNALGNALGAFQHRAGLGAGLFGAAQQGLLGGLGAAERQALGLAGLGEQRRGLDERFAQRGLFNRQAALGFLQQALGMQPQAAPGGGAGGALSGAIGGGLAGFGVGGPIGAGVGALGGLLGGLF